MHDQRESNQNLGNRLGSRPCVRLTDTYRLHESGNQIKHLLGYSSIAWDEKSYNRKVPIKTTPMKQTPQKPGWETSSRAYGAN